MLFEHATRTLLVVGVHSVHIRLTETHYYPCLQYWSFAHHLYTLNLM